MTRAFSNVCVGKTFSAVVVVALGLGAPRLRADPNAMTAPTPAVVNGPVLPVSDFLQQVRAKNDSYKSAQSGKDAAQLKGKEAELVLAPNLFGNGEFIDDKKPGTLYQYDSLKTTTSQLGVSQLTSIGLSGRLYYSVTEQDYKNLNAFGESLSPSILQASPVVELTMPLWRNWLGGETQNQVEQGAAQSEQTLETQAFQMKNVLSAAEQAYWNLALVRETVRVADDSVKRNNYLLAWHKKRARNGLGDEGDLLQAEAALQTSQISLKSAQDNEITASRAFNLARGSDAPGVKESLTPLTQDTIKKLQPPAKQAMREDVKAAYAQVRSTKAASELTRQKYQPTLELFGSAALNNPNPLDRPAAYTDSFSTSRPTNAIGIRLNAPLSAGIIANVRAGVERDQIAAEENYQRKVLEQDDDWHSLNERFRQAQERFRLYSALEEKQQEKFTYEQERRAQGRTTTQQVLLFETDLENAQLARIQALVDLFNIYAQMKLYEEMGQ